MRCVGVLLLGALCAMLSAQTALTFPPPEVFAPDKDQLAAITEKTEALRDKIKAEKITDPDVLIFLKAAEYMLRHGEWYKGQAKMTLAVLDEGIKRARAAGKGRPWLTAEAAGKTVVLGYRSPVDESVQPYAITLPHTVKGVEIPGTGRFIVAARTPHVVLHGRDAGLTEVSFLHRHGAAKPAPKDHQTLTIHLFGRGNNAYRWAGEADIDGAVADCASKLPTREIHVPVDPSNLVLRGFSMGGAGTWHFGLHHPDRFKVIGPGAGFTTTYGYIKGLKKLPPHQDACLTIYDAVRYAENVFNVPVVAYSGEDDPQKAAADNIDAELKKLGLKMTHIVAPKTKHTIPAEYQKKLAQEYDKHGGLKMSRIPNPPEIRFVTHTLRYANCHWVGLHALEQHYARARVEASRTPDGFTVKTANVRELTLRSLSRPKAETARIEIDGQTLVKAELVRDEAGAYAYLVKTDGKWAARKEATPGASKSPGLQGPIDDAFMTPFLCVRGTGKPWNAAVQAHADASLERFRSEWSKYFRGDLRVKDDKDVTEDDIKDFALVLFGDPGSNSLIGKALPKLPFKWDRKQVEWAGKVYDSATHVPVLIHPGPLNPSRYVVLNSGHTFHKADFEGTNALLYPRLGDWALLKITDAKKPLDVDVVTAGLFDERWKFPK